MSILQTARSKHNDYMPAAFLRSNVGVYAALPFELEQNQHLQSHMPAAASDSINLFGILQIQGKIQLLFQVNLLQIQEQLDD